jgi:hypothetical protein
MLNLGAYGSDSENSDSEVAPPPPKKVTNIVPKLPVKPKVAPDSNNKNGDESG